MTELARIHPMETCAPATSFAKYDGDHLTGRLAAAFERVAQRGLREAGQCI